MKTITVTRSYYYVINMSLYCDDTIPSFIGNLWRVLLLGNHLKTKFLLQRGLFVEQLAPRFKKRLFYWAV